MTSEPEPTQRCLQLLAAGVPLTLLWDLCAEVTPPSRQLLEEERADTSWIQAVA